MKTIGNRLKELRIERGLKQVELAEVLSLSLRQVQRYEKDETDMPLSTAISLADFFDVSIDYLTGRNDIKNHGM